MRLLSGSFIEDGGPAGYTVVQNGGIKLVAVGTKTIASAGATGATQWSDTLAATKTGCSFAIKDETAPTSGTSVRASALAWANSASPQVSAPTGTTVGDVVIVMRQGRGRTRGGRAHGRTTPRSQRQSFVNSEERRRRSCRRPVDQISRRQPR